MAAESFLINPPRKKKGRKRGKKRSTYKKRKMSRALYTKRGTLRKARRRTVVVYAQSPKRWVRSRKSKSRRAGVRINTPLMVAGANPPRRYRRRKYSNPRRYRRRRTYRNPVGVMTLQKQFPFILTGAMSAISVVTLPAMLPTMFTATPMMKYGTQLGVAIGGGMLVEMFMRRSGHGMVWAITGSAVVLADMLQRYVLRGMFGLAGMGEDDVYYDPETGEMLVASGEDEGVEAFPDEGYGNGGYGGAGISAFPNESSTY